MNWIKKLFLKLSLRATNYSRPLKHDLIHIVKTNNKRALDQFYIENRSSFIRWAKSRYNLNENDIVDIFQDAIIILYTQIKSGKITAFQKSPESYLFGIAKKIALHRTYKPKKEISTEETNLVNDLVDVPQVLKKIEEEEKKEWIKNVLLKLGPACREIILLYYYHKFDMNSIAHKLGYQNAQVAKSKKSQCMKKLRSLIKSKP